MITEAFPMPAKMIRADFSACCPKPSLRRRPLLAPRQAAALSALFKVLANDTRLRLLHALVRTGEACVSDLALTIQMKPQAVSNQLRRLADRGILECRRSGNRIHYQIADPCVSQLLERGLCLEEDARGRTP